MNEDAGGIAGLCFFRQVGVLSQRDAFLSVSLKGAVVWSLASGPMWSVPGVPGLRASVFQNRIRFRRFRAARASFHGARARVRGAREVESRPVRVAPGPVCRFKWASGMNLRV